MPILAASDAFLYYAHAALCLLLAAGLSWQSWRATRGPRRALRLLAGLLAAAALWLSAYPPQRPAPRAATRAALLLTAGYSPDSVRALRRQLGPLPLLRYRPATAPGGDTLPLASLASLRARHPGVQQLHVLGLGLPVSDLAALPHDLELVAHAAQPGPAFTIGNWNRQLTLGEPLQVAGHFGPAGTDVWVRLRVAGALRDSVRLPADGRFALRYVPRRTGPLLARLEARRGATLLAAEPVPVRVQPARRLRVLALAGTPSFELNLLKNHLADQGHQVALRLGLSRGLVQTEVQNRPGAALGQLTPTLLRGFDLIVADADALQALSAAEARTLAAATADGLGLLLTGATTLPRALPGRSDFALQARPATAAAQPVRISWPSGKAAIALPATLQATPRTRALLNAGPGTAAACVRRTGWGAVVVATPASTFQWLLSGATATYDAYWGALLGAAARPLEPAARWDAPRWPRPDEPQLLTRSAAGLPRAAGRVEAPGLPAAQLALQPHPQQPDVWQAAYWPQRAGWHRATVPGQDTADFYVFGPHEWRGPLQMQRLAALHQWVPRAAAVRAAPSGPQVPWLAADWYFALFVLAAGWLWLDEKR